MYNKNFGPFGIIIGQNYSKNSREITREINCIIIDCMVESERNESFIGPQRARKYLCHVKLAKLKSYLAQARHAV